MAKPPGCPYDKAKDCPKVKEKGNRIGELRDVCLNIANIYDPLTFTGIHPPTRFKGHFDTAVALAQAVVNTEEEEDED